MLKVKKLNKYYHRFGKKPLHVINNTSLEIPETGIIAVIGASGAGKTTLINTISGLDSFRNGSIAFDDIKVKHYHNRIADKLRMKNYGFIFQNYYLLENQNVYENVKVSLDAFSISEEEKKQRISYVLKQLGIAKYMYKPVTSLSGGEQQRVSIARALVKSPRIIFADEPTGSLDEKTTFNVLNILKKVSQKCAVFIVTHERDIISYYADYILELDNGVVVKEFTPVIASDKKLAIDRDIYLSELKHVDSYNKENIVLDIYSDQSNKDTASQIKIAIKDKKIYLESSANITVFTPESENHLVDGKPKAIKDYVSKDFEYDLPQLDFSNNRISLKETLTRGYKNYKTKRPIKRLFSVVCMILSVVLMTLLQESNVIKNADLSSVVTASKGNLYVELVPTSEDMTLAKMRTATHTIVDEVEKSSQGGEILFDSRDTLVYQYNGFYQIENKRFVVPAHDFKNIDSFDESTLVFGHMPESNYDIVIDEYVLERFIDTTLLKTVVTDYGHFVGKKFITSYTNIPLTVVGVCRTKSPTIYGHLSVNFARLSYETRCRLIDIDYAKKLYPETFSMLSLNPGQYLVNIDYVSKDFLYEKLQRVAQIGSNLPFDIIINAADYSNVKRIVSNENNVFYISTDGSQEMINSYLNLMKDVQAKLANEGISVRIEVTNRYQNEYDDYMKTINSIMLILKVVAIVVIVMSLASIVISTYLSMTSQITDIAVYRSLGYSRFNLGLTYFIELFLITLKFIFIGGLATFLAMFVLDVIPIIEFELMTSVWEFLALLGIAAGSVLVIGIIPIIIVFRRTPANLYNHFSKKINNQAKNNLYCHPF